MKFLFLLYACAEKFCTAEIGAINVSLSPKASMAEFHAAKREDAMKFLEFFCKRAERGLEILKFLNARHFGSHKQAAEFLKFAPELPRNRSKILKFTPKLRNRFEILKFTRTSARLADTAQNFIPQRGFEILKLICEPLRIPSRVLPRADIAEAARAARLTSQHTYDVTEKRRAVKFNHAGGYLNSTWRRIVRLRSAATQHGYEAWRSKIYAVCLHKYSALIRAASGKISRYEVGRATNVLLSRGVQRMKFYALNRHAMKFLKFLGASRFGSQTAACFLKFKPEPSRNRSEILNFMFASYKLKFALRKFTSAVRKFKSASAVRLNFDLNSVSQARAAKFEHGAKFKDATKFKRGAR